MVCLPTFMCHGVKSRVHFFCFDYVLCLFVSYNDICDTNNFIKVTFLFIILTF